MNDHRPSWFRRYLAARWRLDGWFILTADHWHFSFRRSRTSKMFGTSREIKVKKKNGNVSQEICLLCENKGETGSALHSVILIFYIQILFLIFLQSGSEQSWARASSLPVTPCCLNPAWNSSTKLNLCFCFTTEFLCVRRFSTGHEPLEEERGDGNFN